MDPLTLTLSVPVAASLAALVWLAIQGTRTALWATLAMSVLTLAVWVWIGWQLGDALSSLSSKVASISTVLGDLVGIFSTALLVWSFFVVLLPVWSIFVAVTIGVFWLRQPSSRA